jgi:hypothetical protein
MANIVIDWVRHAESCTNLLDAKVTDKYNSNNNISGFKSFLLRANEEENEFYKNETKPFKKDINSVNEKLETFIRESNKDDCKKPITNEVIQSECIGEESTDDTCWKETVGACKDSKKAKAAYTRYKMKKSSWLYHPTLSYIGIQQAIALGKDKEFKKILGLQNYKLIITSATARTIMTALLSLQNQTINQNINYQINKIIVMPYINEHENVAGDFGLDRANAALPYDKIDSIVQKIIEWLTNNGHLTGKYLTVDTAFYKQKCQEALKSDHEANPYKANITMFYATLTDLLFEDTTITQAELLIPTNVLAYSHGYVILNRFEEYTGIKPKVFLPNVSIYRETIPNCIKRIHEGMQVRNILGSNSENSVYNLCSLDSLRGDINKLLIGYDINKQNTENQEKKGESYVGGYKKKINKKQTKQRGLKMLKNAKKTHSRKLATVSRRKSNGVRKF